MILGPRGSSDREQANKLAKKYDAIAIHFQDVVQKAANVGDAVSRTIKSSMSKGTPIPDSVLHTLMVKEISQLACQTRGWILTGYPKTASQARSLNDAGLMPNRVFFLSVEKNEAIDRLEGQRIDPVSGVAYHVQYNPPSEPKIRERLLQHPANAKSEIVKHMDIYMTNLNELENCFENSFQIDANFDSETVFEQMDANLVRPFIKSGFT